MAYFSQKKKNLVATKSDASLAIYTEGKLNIIPSAWFTEEFKIFISERIVKLL